MATRERSRTFLIGAAVAALLAPLAIVAAMVSPASAAQMKQHEVYMYKVEKHVDLYGEFPDQNMHEHLYCNPGDIATEGMWRVDNVDQANPPETNGDERDVYFQASYGDPSDRTEWHFRATNFADGKAQIKLWVTCIRGNVEQAFLHSHKVQVDGMATFDHNNLAGDPSPDGIDHGWSDSACAPGSYPIAPGWNVTSSDYGNKVRIFKSFPTSDFKGWTWAFKVHNPVHIRVYLSCIKVKTGAAGSGPHAHQLFMEWRANGTTGVQHHLDVVGAQERRVNCDDGHDGQFFQNYKAMVAAFWISDPRHVWFLGMDPRPKQRAFKFWWDGHHADDVWLGAFCIRARTGKQIAP